jgi:hypothetical protein
MRLHELVKLAEQLRGIHHRRHGTQTITEMIEPLMAIQQQLLMDLGPGTILHRSRKCEAGQRFNTLMEMIYPPPEKTGLGRANLPAQPALYASGNFHTTLDEIAAQPGDLVQTIAVRPVDGQRLLAFLVGEFQSVYNSGNSLVGYRKHEQFLQFQLRQLSVEDRAVQLFVDGFFAEAFRREAKRPQEYLPTAVYASQLAARDLAIVYPSVETPHGINVAIDRRLFDQTCEVVASQVVEVNDYFGFGVYRWRQIAVSNSFSPNGEISWLEADANPNVQFGVQPTLKGWRPRAAPLSTGPATAGGTSTSC